MTVIEVSDHSEFASFNLRPSPGTRYQRHTLFSGPASHQVRTIQICRSLVGKLSVLRPDVIAVPGWAAPEALSALAWAVRHSVPAILMSDSQRHDRPRDPITEYVKRRVVRLFSAALVGGSSHVDYALALGVPNNRIFTGYDVVDNDHFARGADAARRNPSARAQFGLPAQYFLASCRFEAKKNISGLLEAYARYRKIAQERWHLVLLGDGRLAPHVRADIARLELHDFVHLPGFRQYGELPTFYGLASAFVHASTTEQWGLVVNEAMAAGLPVIVSERCGCAPDLVEDGRNGFTFDPYDTDALAALLLKLSSMTEDERRQMGMASREIISRWGPETFARNLAKAIETALASPPPRATLFDKALLRALMHR